jgi:hypothetical protein
MRIQNPTFVETHYGNSITFWGSTNAALRGNSLAGDGQLKQRGRQIIRNTTGVVDSNIFMGGTHLDLIEVGGTSLNTPSAMVTKGLFYVPIGGGSSSETGSTLKIANWFGNSTAPAAGDLWCSDRAPAPHAAHLRGC